MTRDEIIGDKFKDALQTSALSSDELRLNKLRSSVEETLDTVRTDFTQKLLMQFRNELDKAISALNDARNFKE